VVTPNCKVLLLESSNSPPAPTVTHYFYTQLLYTTPALRFERGCDQCSASGIIQHAGKLNGTAQCTRTTGTAGLQTQHQRPNTNSMQESPILQQPVWPIRPCSAGLAAAAAPDPTAPAFNNTMASSGNTPNTPSTVASYWLLEQPHH
jgi:hypothetical protein